MPGVRKVRPQSLYPAIQPMGFEVSDAVVARSCHTFITAIVKCPPPHPESYGAFDAASILLSPRESLSNSAEMQLFFFRFYRLRFVC